MATFDINSIIITGTLFVIFGVFLFFDIFNRNERYGYLAYIVALLPINFLWFLQFDVLGVYFILFICNFDSLLSYIFKNNNKKIKIKVLLLFLDFFPAPSDK
ncbi:unnamed protein product [marine sediment metagenome]|uniref:Uncharacterized protein n=1 Tax=marine sediment metagenome TaxID=412755 RepID=X1C713_9ZZZZ